jgi:hypothetical protein
VSLGLGLLKGGMLLNLFLSRRHLIQDKYRQQEAPDSCKKETPQGREKNWNARTYYEDLYTKNVVGGVVDVESKRGGELEQVDMALMTRVCHRRRLAPAQLLRQC